ncbi:GM19412 [Drosophila sechellia]|uniref:GM19412 n=1 Tax=Drosophila sechellia TaxID=7238 RepID=B4IKJ6_DROSE|nr:GM19412 [Drosophila sechellia]
MRMLNCLNYILIAVIARATCESLKLEEIAIKTLDCRENTCTNLRYPSASEVAYFPESVTKHLRKYESLVLHSSQLANLPRKIFLNLPQLVEFHVLECELQQIEKCMF